MKCCQADVHKYTPQIVEVSSWQLAEEKTGTQKWYFGLDGTPSCNFYLKSVEVLLIGENWNLLF